MAERLTYSALMVDDTQQRILLSTRKGEAGYRIVKFQVIPNDIIGSTAHEASIQVWKTEQSVIDDEIDFNNNRLLAAAYYIRTTSGGGTPTAVTDNQTVIFENEIINQDIYVTYKDGQGGQKMNYYLELERIKLSEHDAMVATIKNIRNG